jgi:AcrR family transcriptional regulator
MALAATVSSVSRLPTPTPPPDGPTTDGRHLRRERGRLAAIDATIDLVGEGHVPPSAEKIAERAGLSVASVFRYFDTLDDLRRAVAQVYVERSADLFEIPSMGQGPRAERIANLVASRVRLYESTEPMARLVRRQAHERNDADELVHRLRATRADQVRQHFDPELRALTPAVGDDLVMIVSTLTSFEAWDQARYDHHRSPAQVRRAWARALTGVLAP